MLSHDNIYWEAESANDFAQFAEAKEVIISYLPLSHIAGNDIFTLWKSQKVDPLARRVLNRSGKKFEKKWFLPDKLLIQTQYNEELRP